MASHFQEHYPHQGQASARHGVVPSCSHVLIPCTFPSPSARLAGHADATWGDMQVLLLHSYHSQQNSIMDLIDVADLLPLDCASSVSPFLLGMPAQLR